MSPLQSKLITLITYLSKLTQEEELSWERLFPPDSLSSKTEVVFETTFEDRKLRIYEEYYKNWYDEDNYVWDSRVVLSFIDSQGRTEWEFPPVAGLGDLLESVKYRSANVGGFLDSVLKKHDLSKKHLTHF
ncbi:MAG: hypothetical protein QME81_08750 [bacterium]|nr:hypothetical protein [bacterium]